MAKKIKRKKARVTEFSNWPNSDFRKSMVTGGKSEETIREPEPVTFTAPVNGKKAKKQKHIRNATQTFAMAPMVTMVGEEDVSILQKNVGQLVKGCKTGDYPSVLAKANLGMIRSFITNYAAEDEEGKKKVQHITRGLLRVAKTLFEYHSNSILTDEEYDALLAAYLSTGETEPTPIVQKTASSMEKTDIKYRLLHNNMDKSYRLREVDPVPEGVKEQTSVEEFLTRVYKELGMELTEKLPIELSPKIDGVSVNGTISGNELLCVQTRGDENASILVKGLSQKFLAEEPVETAFGIQYEAFVLESDLPELEKLGYRYVSCRHAASGIVRRLCTTPDEVLAKFVNLYPIAAEGLDLPYYKMIKEIQRFQKFTRDDLDMVSRKQIIGNYETLLEVIEEKFVEFENLRNTLDFAIDGMVITVAENELQEKLGRNGRTNRYQIAMKFDPANAISTVKGVHLDAGTKGYRTIQVDLETPVFLDGVRYEHVPVLSAALFEELGLHYKDSVRIHRVGDVIPSLTVLSKEHKGDKINLPDTCPGCGEFLIVKDKKLFCDNPDCKMNRIGKILGFFMRLDLEGYSESFASMLVNSLDVKHIRDLFFMSPEYFHAREITTKAAEEFQNKLLDCVSKHKDYEVLAAMGLPGIGKQKARQIVSKFGFHELANLTRDHIMDEIRGFCVSTVGPNRYEALMTAITSEDFVQDILSMKDIVTKLTDTTLGYVIQVGHTGKNLSEEAVEICDNFGAEVVDGTKFDILVTSDLSSESRKMSIAKKRGNPIVLEDQLKEVLEYAQAYYKSQDYLMLNHRKSNSSNTVELDKSTYTMIPLPEHHEDKTEVKLIPYDEVCKPITTLRKEESSREPAHRTVRRSSNEGDSIFGYLAPSIHDMIERLEEIFSTKNA